MKTKRLLLATIMLIAALTLYANPRSKKTMERAAAEVLNSRISNDGIKRSPRKERLVELQSNESITVMGYQSGGYAIIANDDRMPAVLGYSDTKFDTNNPEFNWYLDGVKEVLREKVKSNIKYVPIAPDTSVFIGSVAPLIKTHWTQTQPYNGMCPEVSGSPYGGRAPTGCVATAMAQIIRYNQTPSHGTGVVSVTVPSSKEVVTVDLSQSNYDFGNMLDEYTGSYTQQQADAVAKLMRDCGVAAQMAYDAYSASCATGNGCKALNNYFGYRNASLTKKRLIGTNAWMKRLFAELAAGRPVMYAGSDPKTLSGHAFIIDGYQKDGKVHVNWGWGGLNDGFYDISVFADNCNYTSDQMVVIGLQGAPVITDSVVISSPGTLEEVLRSRDNRVIKGLKIKGEINSTDLGYIRRLAGRGVNGKRTNGNLHALDLRDARIVEGGDPYLVDSTGEYVTSNDILPEYALYGCSPLEYLAMPSKLDSIAPSALANLPGLDSVWTSDKFRVIGNAVFSSDTTVLIKVFNNASGKFYVNPKVRYVSDYAMDGCNFVTEVRTYPRLEGVGKRAFANMTEMKEFRFSTIHDLKPGEDVFLNKNPKCVLYNRDRVNMPWHDYPEVDIKFADVKEWGVPAYAEGKHSRLYGEKNPKLEIEPNMSAIANTIPQKILDSIKKNGSVCVPLTPKTPVGKYHVYAASDYPEYYDYPVYFCGDNFVINKNLARIIVDTCYVEVGTLKPVFTYKIDSLQNGETGIPEEDWSVDYLPSVFAGMNGGCVEYPRYDRVGARYRLTFGGISRNYEFHVIDGLAIVVPKKTSGISEINDTASKSKSIGQRLYNLQGMLVNENYEGIVISNGKKYYGKKH